jgi:hypothetical protein
VFISQLVAENFFDPENLINNGGFELNKKHRWIIKGNAQITSEFSYEGENSLKLSGDNLSSGYVFQHFEDPIKNFEATFWIYPDTKSFATSLSFVSDWDKTGLNNILSITFTNTEVIISSPDSVLKKSLELENKYWYNISISTDSSGLKKTIFINDIFICSISTEDVSQIETLIIGNLNCPPCSGIFYFDDISVFDNAEKDENSLNPGIAASVGLGRTFVGPTFYFGASYRSDGHLISFRFIKGDEFQLSFGHPNYESPNENIKESALLYGRYLKKQNGIISVSGGIGYVKAIQRGGESNKIEISTFGFALEGRLRYNFSDYWGLGFSLFTNINGQKITTGIAFCVYLGQL